MRGSRLWVFTCSGCALICAVVLAWGPLYLPWRIFAVILLILSLAAGCIILLREQRHQHERALHMAHQSALELMNHQRHDWMNELQLLYGYVKLNRTEQLRLCVEGIKSKMIEEGRIAKLGIPELTLYLLHVRVSGHAMPVYVHLPRQIDLTEVGLLLEGRVLTDMIKEGVQVMRLAPKASADAATPLQFMIDIRSDDALGIRFLYEGQLLQPDDVRTQLDRLAAEHGVRLEQVPTSELQAGASIFEWIVPCKARD
ncbi:Spo0B domain-containing protein [Paenibacillus sp. SC116]|uniref:Spo0B domain-containing protein n=1 Tax=Paenibacillus sp. SC116 TaxID=2968986 RepID=UPI00215A855F|nr:Spo0B domain-containing protein [Paenibacillus sp. SC116]MCR8846261.1 Spo0B domain-containing protein [Paenibacillus sp. SC116]